MRNGDFQLIEHDFADRRVCSVFSAIASVASSAIQANAAKKAAGLQADAARESLDFQREQFETSRQDLAPFSQVGLGALNELSRLFLGTDSPVALRNAAAGGLAPEAFDPSNLVAEREGLVNQLNAPTGQFRDDFGNTTNELGQPLFNPNPGPESQDAVQAIQDRIAAIDQELEAGRTPDTSTGTFTPGQLSQEERQANFFTSPGFTFRRDEGEKAINRALSARGLSNSGSALRELTSFNSGLASGEFNNFANRLAALAGIGQSATNAGVGLAQSFGQSGGQALQDAGTASASGVVGQANAFNQGISNLDFANRNNRNFFSNFGFGNTGGGTGGRAGGVGTPGVGGGFFNGGSGVGGGDSRLAVF